MATKRLFTPYEIQQECLRMHENGMTPMEIYRTYYVHQFSEDALPCRSIKSFKNNISKWGKRHRASPETLYAGTYENFTPHGATVQVNANGDIVQAWIKQDGDGFDAEKFISGILKDIPKYERQTVIRDGNRMLEIPLFDMHFGVADFDYYEPVLREILDVIESRKWDVICIPFGQDFFHNDSITKGVTSHGTPIEKIDMEQAVYDGKRFVYELIDTAIDNAVRVRVLYTPGNHDKSISWMFTHALLERYGSEVVDISTHRRKCITYGDNAIMFTHGDSKRATAKRLASMFPVKFPTEFASATLREVHCGHLHHEEEGDEFGVMVRRLSTRAKEDDWSDDEDFIGSIKRFMLFEWGKQSLKSIHYI